MTPHQRLDLLLSDGDPRGEVLAIAIRARELGQPPRRFIVEDETVLDVTTGLTWQRSTPAEHFTWAAAKEYAAQLAFDGGGWRLPTREELFCLADRRRTDPAIDTDAFPNTPATSFWSATQYAVVEGFVWLVNFDDGGAHAVDEGRAYAVRCVR
jgi:formylglycine-generating enzyme required for sulfatase activity